VNTEAYEELVHALLARALRRALEHERLVPGDIKGASVSTEDLASAAVRAGTILQQYYARARSQAGRFIDL
jgi:hypothetical protein